MDRPYTQADFARDAAQIAREAANWADGCLTNAYWRERPMRTEDAAHFVEDIRARLQRIEDACGSDLSNRPVCESEGEKR